MSNEELNDAEDAAALFVQTNQPENSVVAFQPNSDGTLAGRAAYSTGRSG